MSIVAIAPTFLAATTLAAAVDSGLLEGERRVLVVTNSAPIPEVTPGLEALPGFSAIASRFDAVVDLNAAIEPRHPRDVFAGSRESARLREAIETAAQEPVTRVVTQSLHVQPAGTVVRLFPQARIDALADGLMAYGPTRSHVGPGVGARLDRLLHLDLVPGVVPRLFADLGITPTPIGADAYAAVVADVASASGAVVADAVGNEAWILGQYLVALGLITEDQEAALHVEMLDKLVESGHREIAFKPHPSSPPGHHALLEARARELGVSFRIMTETLPVEVLLAQQRPAAVIGCFSTGLAIAQGMYGVPADTVGAAQVARALPSLEDSNRVPLLIAALTLPADTAADAATVQEAVDAACAAMQPGRYRAPSSAAASDPRVAAFLEGTRSQSRWDPRRLEWVDYGSRRVGRLWRGRPASLWRRARSTVAAATYRPGR